MLCLTKKTEYALIALAYLAENGKTASAREIAASQSLPLPLLMNILKTLQAHEVLRSTRGVKGGYQIAVDLNQFSLFDLIAIVECRKEAGTQECGCMNEVVVEETTSMAQAVQRRLEQFLKALVVSEVLLPQSDNRRLDYVHHID